MSETAPTPTPTAPPAPKFSDADWKDKEIRDLRDEAASRRVENNALKEQVTALTGQVQAFTTQVTELGTTAETATASLLKLNVALSAGVPGEQAAEFAELLQGSTEQELKDYAEKIRKFNGGQVRPGYDPTQGLGGDDNTPLTPEQEFNAVLARFIN